jgi:branched-chain amino acid transport system ATP-binding protein
MVLLQLRSLTKSFGGLQAVVTLELDVDQGEILGLIGPNGSGKTTIFNLITGFLQPDNGDIVFEGNSILNLKPHNICELGITRTFQIVKPFSELTVLENVMIGAFSGTKESNIAKREALQILDDLEFAHIQHMKAGALTISERKYLEIARALATRPKLFLIDEPMAGMNPSEVDGMIRHIQKIREGGITVFIIEHVMRAIMAISDRVAVLHNGKKIADGTPKEITANQDVITAYLGENYIES